MKEEEIYDYAKGLSAPYWIQEVRTKKGKVLLSFAVPMQLSYFVVFALVLGIMIAFMQPLMNVLYAIFKGGSYLAYWYLPNKLARLYSEGEVDGKNMLYFLYGYARYFLGFVLNRKPIYQSERIKENEEVTFEKVNL